MEGGGSVSPPFHSMKIGKYEREYFYFPQRAKGGGTHIAEFLLPPPKEKNTVMKGRLQSKYKFVLKAAFLYTDIPAKIIFLKNLCFSPQTLSGTNI